MGKQNPDQTEKWAQDYFGFLGFAPDEIVFEPDGNVPPDFVLRGKTAVEVRRLNQHWRAPSGAAFPLEHWAEPFTRSFEKFLKDLGPPTHGVCWDVAPQFSRPRGTTWRSQLARELAPYQRNEIGEGEREIRIDSQLRVQMVRRSAPAEETFRLAGIDNLDSGGWVDEELHNNIALGIEEKTAKVASYRAKYPEWWLVLVDHMMGGRPAEKGPARIAHTWDKVVVIHPANYGWAYEVLNPQR